MAHYKRMFNSQRGDGVFDGRPLAPVRGAVRRNQGACVAQYEEIARLSLHQQVRRDARIRTCNQQGVRLLPLRKDLKQFPVRAKGRGLEMMDASYNLFHNTYPAKGNHGKTGASAKKDTTITPISFQRLRSSQWLCKYFRAQFYGV
jgi:hypothetical protein